MIAVDSSALLAILMREADAAAIATALLQGQPRCLSAASFVETSMVIEVRHGADGVRELDNLIDRAEIEIIPVDVQQARLAREAFRRFGKGRHKAGLNFGDCFAYALAKSLGAPLLCKGKDFSHTDIEMAA